jgi:hypothetical protein
MTANNIPGLSVAVVEDGNLCPNFMKDCDWTWICTDHAGQRSGHIDGEASKKAANAYCPFHDEILMKKKAAAK